MRCRLRIFLCVLVFVTLSLFEVWFLGVHETGVSHPISRGDLVDSYTEALSQGKISLQTPTAKLAELPAPLQPLTDPRTRILDASYYQGKYYIYYGILPFMLVLVPWKLATGSYLNAEFYLGATLAFGNALLLISFLRLYRNRQERGLSLFIPMGLAIGILCSGSFAVMDLPEIHQVEAVTAYLLNCAIACGLLFSFQSARNAIPGLLLAVAASTLLMASRPNLAFTVIWVTGFALWQTARNSKLRVEQIQGTALVLVIPTMVGGALGLFNYLRFGNPLEFGMNYGTGAVSRPDVVGFSLKNILYNLTGYLFGRFQCENYFPFISGPFHPDADVRPLTHEGFDQVYGIFLLYPALIFAAGALLFKRRLATLFLVPASASLLLLSGLGFGTYRYAADFAVFFAVAAGIGSVESCARQKHLAVVCVTGLALVLTSVSAVGAICLASSTASIHGLMDVRRKDDFNALAGPFNWLRYRYERVSGQQPRAIALEVKLPQHYGAVEPLYVTGQNGLQDFLYLHYTDPTSLRIGFESMGRGGPVSAPIEIDYAKSHRIDVICGNQFPPSSHPLFLNKSSTEIEAFRQTLEVRIDGIIVVQAKVSFHPRKGYEYLGRSPFDTAFGQVFTGTITPLKGMRLEVYVSGIQ